MSEPAAVPLPRAGEVFFDVRGEARSMRLSWYADSRVAVFSIWQGNRCTGTFRLPFAELARMVQTLQSGPGPRPQAAEPGETRQVGRPALSDGPGFPDDSYGHSARDVPGYEGPRYGPEHAERSYAERSYAERSHGAETYAEPGYPAPGYGEPDYPEPGYPEPGYGEPGYGTPGHAGPGYGGVPAYSPGPATRSDATHGGSRYSLPDYDPPDYSDVPPYAAADRRRSSIYTGAFSNSGAASYANGSGYAGSGYGVAHSAPAGGGYDNAAGPERGRGDAEESAPDTNMLSFPSVPARNGPAGNGPAGNGPANTDWGAATASYPAP